MQRDIQCANCGHYFNSEHPYFSEDFARAFLAGQNVGLSWCLHCGYFSEYRQKKRFLIFKARDLGLVRTFPANEMKDAEYFSAPFGSMGGLFGFQMLRMMWYAVDARAKLDHGLDHKPISTLRELLKRLPPVLAALSIVAVWNNNRSLRLEEILALGIYSSEIDWGFKDQMIQLLQSEEGLPNAALVVSVLTEATKTSGHE